MRVTQPVTGASWTKVKFAPVCCVWVIAHLGTGSSLLKGSKVTDHCYNCNMRIIHWYIISGCFIDHLNRSSCRTIGPDYFFWKTTSVRSTHTIPQYTPPTKSDLRLLRSGSFFCLPCLSFLLLGSSPPLAFFCFPPLGFCVVNGGESLRDEKGKDATPGKLSVKDRGVDRWRGWEHERMTEERIE